MVDSRPNRDSDPFPLPPLNSKPREEAVKKAAKRVRRKPRGQWSKNTVAFLRDLGCIILGLITIAGLIVALLQHVAGAWQELRTLFGW